MKTIKTAKMNIGISLYAQDDFKQLDKYYVDEPYTYTIESRDYDDLIMPRIAPAQITEYFSLYDLEDYVLQIQSDKSFEGAIIYQKNNVYLYPKKKDYVTEYLLSQYAFLYLLSKNNGILMHGSSFIYNGKGIILTAKSGTGKSTHSRLWQKYGDIEVINDDKNALLLENGEVIMYGNPWSGKHHLDNNIACKLDSIVFLHQAKDNEVSILKPKNALLKLLGQVVIPYQENKDAWNQITDIMLKLPIYDYGCNMEQSAYLTLKERLDNDLWQ